MVFKNRQQKAGRVNALLRRVKSNVLKETVKYSCINLKMPCFAWTYCLVDTNHIPITKPYDSIDKLLADYDEGKIQGKSIRSSFGWYSRDNPIPDLTNNTIRFAYHLDSKQ